MAVMTFAQGSVKVTAQFSKGDYVIYEILSSIVQQSSMAGNDTASYVGEIKYEVTDARKDGYTITDNTLKWDSTKPIGNDLTKKISTMQQRILVDKPIVLTTDKDGKIIRLNNFEEIKQKIDLFIDDMVNTLFEGLDQEAMGAMPLSRDGIRDAIMDEITEEKMIETLSNNTGNHLSLYGKTFTTGTVTDEKMNNFSFKTTYVVPSSKNKDTYSLKSSSVINMSKDDIKKLIIEQLEKMMPEQADAIKENIDMVLEGGMIKIDGTRQCTYDFFKNGWLKSGEVVSNINAMGNESITTSKWSIKESHIK